MLEDQEDKKGKSVGKELQLCHKEIQSKTKRKCIYKQDRQQEYSKQEQKLYSTTPRRK